MSNFETLLRELPVGIAVSFDPSCANIRVNPALAQMLGIDEHQNASKTGKEAGLLGFRVLQDGLELQADQLPMQVAAREKREIEDFEADIVRADGTVRRELGRAVPLLDVNGDVRGSLAVFVDITERRQAEEALRESEERFRNMAENAPVMIWITNQDGACTFVNRQWCEFTGTTLEQNLGLEWIESVHPEDREKTFREFVGASGRHEPFRMEYRLRRKDGEWRWVVDSASQRLAEDGTFLGYIGSVIDMTERIEMERAVQASEEQFALAQAAADRYVDLGRARRAPLRSPASISLCTVFQTITVRFPIGNGWNLSIPMIASGLTPKCSGRCGKLYRLIMSFVSSGRMGRCMAGRQGNCFL